VLCIVATMAGVYIEFPSKPNYVLATVSDTAVQGQLTVLSFDPAKKDGRLFTLGNDGFIYLTANPNLVLDVSGASAFEGIPVILYPKKNPVAANQQW